MGHVPSVAKIREALLRIKPLKVICPDDFHPIFFHKTWNIVGPDVGRDIEEWFRLGRIPKELCQALLCLIPKQPSPNTVKQFQPISLFNTLYKLVTEVIVTRLKQIILT